MKQYRSSVEFTALLDKEVGLEMVDLIYCFKRFNPGHKLNLNFVADPPLLPKGVTEEMIEDYEGEDAYPAAEGARNATASDAVGGSGGADGCLLEVILQVFDIPRMTEGLVAGVSQSVCSRSEDTDDLIRPFPGRSEGSFRWIFGRQGDLAHDLDGLPISTGTTASDPKASVGLSQISRPGAPGRGDVRQHVTSSFWMRCGCARACQHSLPCIEMMMRFG
ncbi:unnamed protein product [Prunus armeniaca]